MKVRWFIVSAVTTILLAACGNTESGGSNTPKDFPEPTPSCVSCPTAGYHCGEKDGKPACVPD